MCVATGTTDSSVEWLNYNKKRARIRSKMSLYGGEEKEEQAKRSV